MANDIIKREIIDSDESKKAKKDIEKLIKKAENAKEKERLKAAETSAAAQPQSEPAGQAPE